MATEDYFEFKAKKELNGSTSILVEGMYIKNIRQPKEGGDIYGEFNEKPCMVTIINEKPVVIVLDKNGNNRK